MASNESYLSLFLRFLRFGLLAWGGPVTQIAMIKKELVNEQKWIGQEKFNRVLAVYQAIPGPEAHELCVYFGHLAKGRLGGLLAGLGFMLPGLLLVLLLSFLYSAFGLNPYALAVFAAIQPAVVALIIRAVYRIANGAVTSIPLLIIAVFSAASTLLGAPFIPVLLLSGLSCVFFRKKIKPAAIAVLIMSLSLAFLSPVQLPAAHDSGGQVSLPDIFFSGLKAGLLTFGGAYTAIPFLQHDAVQVHGYITNAQFLDGLALSSIIPAPLIIFSAFIGFLGAGLAGALLMTLGIFLPAFAFTLVGYRYLEKVIEHKPLHSFLDGVTAGVVGLIAVTAAQLFNSAVSSILSLFIFSISVAVLHAFNSRFAAPAVIFLSALAGILAFIIAS